MAIRISGNSCKQKRAIKILCAYVFTYFLINCKSRTRANEKVLGIVIDSAASVRVYSFIFSKWLWSIVSWIKETQILCTRRSFESRMATIERKEASNSRLRMSDCFPIRKSSLLIVSAFVANIVNNRSYMLESLPSKQTVQPLISIWKIASMFSAW